MFRNLMIIAALSASLIPAQGVNKSRCCLSFEVKGKAVQVFVCEDVPRFCIDGADVDACCVQRKGNTFTVCAPGGERVCEFQLLGDAEPIPKRTTLEIGLDVRPGDDVLSAQLGVDSGGILVIESVVDGKPAKKAGVRRHDVVTHIQGRAPVSKEILRSELNRLTPGEKLELRVLRRCQPVLLEVHPQVVQLQAAAMDFVTLSSALTGLGDPDSDGTNHFVVVSGNSSNGTFTTDPNMVLLDDVSSGASGGSSDLRRRFAELELRLDRIEALLERLADKR